MFPKARFGFGVSLPFRTKPIRRSDHRRVPSSASYGVVRTRTCDNRFSEGLDGPPVGFVLVPRLSKTDTLSGVLGRLDSKSRTPGPCC